jgi:hypothetical protein
MVFTTNTTATSGTPGAVRDAQQVNEMRVDHLMRRGDPIDAAIGDLLILVGHLATQRSILRGCRGRPTARRRALAGIRTCFSHIKDAAANGRKAAKGLL